MDRGRDLHTSASRPNMEPETLSIAGVRALAHFSTKFRLSQLRVGGRHRHPKDVWAVRVYRTTLCFEVCVGRRNYAHLEAHNMLSLFFKPQQQQHNMGANRPSSGIAMFHSSRHAGGSDLSPAVRSMFALMLHPFLSSMARLVVQRFAEHGWMCPSATPPISAHRRFKARIVPDDAREFGTYNMLPTMIGTGQFNIQILVSYPQNHLKSESAC